MSTNLFPSRPVIPALARGCVALAGALLLTIGTFTICAAAEPRTVRIDCPAEKSKDIKLKGAETGTIFEVYGCACSEERDLLLEAVAEVDGMRDDKRSHFIIGEDSLEPGEVYEKTLYCLSLDEIKAFWEGTTSQ